MAELTRLVRRPDSWLTLKLTDQTTEADVRDLYSHTLPNGGHTISMFKFGTPARILIETKDQFGTFTAQFSIGDTIFFGGANFVALAVTDEYVKWSDVYKDLPVPLPEPLPIPANPAMTADTAPGAVTTEG